MTVMALRLALMVHGNHLLARLTSINQIVQSVSTTILLLGLGRWTHYHLMVDLLLLLLRCNLFKAITDSILTTSLITDMHHHVCRFIVRLITSC